MRSSPSVAFALVSFAALVACKDGASRPPPAQCPEPAADASTNAPKSSAPKSSAPWPTLPRTPDAVQSLVTTTTTRISPYARPSKELDAEALFAKLEPEALAKVVAGAEPIRAFLAAKVAEGSGDGYLLVGGNHGSRAQVEAFRRLVEVPASYTHVALEVLAADGHWSGLPDADQRGATDALAAYVTKGDAATFAALRKAHDEDDYVAWKLGYSPVVMDLAVGARAGAYTLVPVDMSAALKARLGDLGQALLDARELHASLTLRSVLSGERPRAKVAMLWGDAHVGQSGIGRFLPAGATVVTVHLLGGRTTPDAPEKKLAGKVVLDAPVLLPVGDTGDRFALVLPDVHTGGDVDRVLANDGPARGGDAAVAFVCDGGAKLYLRGAVHDLGAKPLTVAVPPGSATYVVVTKETRVVGVLDVGAGEASTVAFDPRSRTTRIEHHAPKR